MGGYDLDEYEEYEDEGEDQEEEVGEYEEEDEEDRLPTQEELEYLELRQKLKDSIRKKMKKDSGSGLANLREKKKKMPYDNFGSFFGPSQPVIAQRVIQESKSLLENPHLAARVPKPKNVAKPKAKIQMLKDTRDYSFLLSDDADLPVPIKNPPKSVSAPKPEAHSSQRQLNNSARKVINGRDERRPLPTSSQMRAKAVPQSQRPSTSSKATPTSLESRKQLGRNEGSGPGRPLGQRPLPSKMPVANKQKVLSPSVSRGSIPTGHKPLPSRPLPATHKKPLEHKRDDRGPSKGNIKQQPARPPASAQQKPRPQKRPARPFDDDDEDENAISMIRSIYNPNRYRGANDDDDSDMEAGFDDIMREEKRRWNKIGQN
ncbi:Chromatin SPT2 [Cynara cardunculus var. scolymus]|uniref:Chromatin SPT2 n=1 Tax=Cynara cardunculus var. scolymus TaxID=59895 RepID=A0A118JSU1_CYNCS|nr:Chromatin SPT2 [Cynara cardunculus var. scolymus]